MVFAMVTESDLDSRVIAKARDSQRSLKGVAMAVDSGTFLMVPVRAMHLGEVLKASGKVARSEQSSTAFPKAVDLEMVQTASRKVTRCP